MKSLFFTFAALFMAALANAQVTQDYSVYDIAASSDYLYLATTKGVVRVAKGVVDESQKQVVLALPEAENVSYFQSVAVDASTIWAIDNTFQIWTRSLDSEGGFESYSHISAKRQPRFVRTDSQGNVWVIGVDVQRVNLFSVLETYSYNLFSSICHPSDVVFDSSGRDFWFCGTYTGSGAYHYNSATNEVETLPIGIGHAYGIAPDSKGHVWVAPNATYLQEIVGNEVTNYTSDNSNSPNTKWFKIGVDAEDRLWLETNPKTSLYQFDGNRFDAYPAEVPTIMRFLLNDGILYAGTDAGLYVIVDGKVISYSDYILDMKNTTAAESIHFEGFDAGNSESIRYNLQGMQVDEHYRGLILTKDGKKWKNR